MEQGTGWVRKHWVRATKDPIDLRDKTRSSWVLQRALEATFHSVNDLADMTREHLKVNLNTIISSSATIEQALFQLVQTWGCSRDSLGAIAIAALQTKPESPQLQEFAARCRLLTWKSPAQLKELPGALKGIYRSEDAFAPIAHELGFPDSSTLTGSLHEKCVQLVEWAKNNDLIEDVVDRARYDNPRRMNEWGFGDPF